MDKKATNTAPGPVFIVGVNGSGTTMLADCLGRHPDLYIFPEETKVLPYFIYKIKSFGDPADLDTRKRLAEELGKCWAYREINNGKPVVLEDKMLSKPGFYGVLNGLYGYFAGSKGKKRWGEKTPMYLQHLEILSKFIPKAKFLHIYRDGRDVAQSLHRRFCRDPRRTIYRWKKIMKYSRSQGNRLKSRYMEISYEDLTGDPELYMRKICNFLELRFDSSVLRSSMPYFNDNSSNIKKGTIASSRDKWKSYFDKDMCLQLEKIAGSYLEELGYNTAFCKGDLDLTRLRSFVLKLGERIKQTIKFFRGNRKRALFQFYIRSREAIKQDTTNRF